jgi:hypothetical protein
MGNSKKTIQSYLFNDCLKMHNFSWLKNPHKSDLIEIKIMVMFMLIFWLEKKGKWRKSNHGIHSVVTRK